MSRLWRSCPPVYLLLWLSKWLRKSRGLNLGVGSSATGNGKQLRSRVFGAGAESAPRTKPPKSKRVKPEILVGIDRKGEVLRYKYDGEQLTKLPEPHDYEPTEGTDYKKRKLS